MQPSEEAKRAIPNHEFYSPFVFLEQFLSVPEKYYHKSAVFVKHFFPFYNRFVFHASVANRHLRPLLPKCTRYTNARRISGGRLCIWCILEAADASADLRQMHEKRICYKKERNAWQKQPIYGNIFPELIKIVPKTRKESKIHDLGLPVLLPRMAAWSVELGPRNGREVQIHVPEQVIDFLCAVNR